MYRVTKSIHFCYGHRLMHHTGKCRHLHGHSARADITLVSEQLNEQGMVRDFADIKQVVGTWIDRELDHNLLLHQQDPVLPLLQQAGERLMVVSEHPTAEFLAKLIYQQTHQAGLPVDVVTVWETDSACASYSEGD